MKSSYAVAGLFAALLALPLSAPSAQENYPSKPIRWVVGYPAGGGTDVLARNVGSQLAVELGQPVVIENRPGAAGIIAGDHVAKAVADGYTIMTGDNGMLVYNPALYKDLSYRPDTDYKPVGLMAKIHLLLITHPESGIKDGKELLAAMKANPGKFYYATPGSGSPHHLAMELFKDETGIDAVHVPYKGGAAAINDLMGGHVPLMLLDLPSGAGAVRSGKVVPLVSFSSERIEQLKDVPTMGELGYPEVEAYAWSGVVVPNQTDDAIVDRLNTALVQSLAHEDVRKRMYEAGQDPIPGTPQDMADYMKQETQKWHKLIADRQITIE